MVAIDARFLEELRDALAEHKVRYLFIGKGAAILQGFPDTTQDADIFVAKDPENAERLTRALRQAGAEITREEADALRRGKDIGDCAARRGSGRCIGGAGAGEPEPAAPVTREGVPGGRAAGPVHRVRPDPDTMAPASYAGVAQLVRARGSYPRSPGFKSLHRHHLSRAWGAWV